MAYTRTQIRQRIGGVEFLNDTLLSTASTNGSAAGASLIDTTQKQPDSFFNYGQVLIGSGTSIGDLRYVASWTQSASMLIPDRAFTSVISSGVSYELHRLNTYTEKNDAINAAIRSGGKRWARRVEDSALIPLLDTDTYTYSLAALTIPLDPELGIDDILYYPNITGTGYPYTVIHPSFYVVRWTAGVPTLQFLNQPPIDAQPLRIVYRVLPAQLATDAATLDPNDDAFYNYVCAKACAILFRARALNAPEAGYELRAQAMEAMAESFFDLDKPQPPPKAVINRNLLWGETPYRNSGWW